MDKDDSFDPCECLWNHNMGIRRLLSFLRESQDYCTETECFNELPGSYIDSRQQGCSFMVAFWLFIVVLYILQSFGFESRRRRDVLKFRNNENDSSDNSSSPPPIY